MSAELFEFLIKIKVLATSYIGTVNGTKSRRNVHITEHYTSVDGRRK